jgi:hypothetical protein
MATDTTPTWRTEHGDTTAPEERPDLDAANRWLVEAHTSYWRGKGLL